jgi:hypothetical protein
MSLAAGGRLILPILLCTLLGKSLWLGRKSKMLLDIVQSRSVHREHTIKEVEPLDNLIEDLSCRKVFSHFLS